MKRTISAYLLLPVLLASCNDAGDSRSFWYYLNERYQLSQIADLGTEIPCAHAYFVLFEEHFHGDFIQHFDKEKSISEFRVRVENNRPIGFGFVRLFSLDSNDYSINVDINEYKFSVLDYQFGRYLCSDFSSTEPFYCGLREFIRFRLPVYIEAESRTRLLTFEYAKTIEYEYPEEFKDLSWLL